MGIKLYRGIGLRIRNFRRMANLTQERLAEKADLSLHFFGFYRTWEGKTKYRYSRQVIFCFECTNWRGE